MTTIWEGSQSSARTAIRHHPLTIAVQRDPIAIALDPGFVRGRSVSPAVRRYNIRISGRPGRPIGEMKLAAPPNVGDHRRRILDHQEKVEAEQRTPPAARPSEPQLRIP